MTKRKLATIRKITDVKPILDADFICTYLVDGWTIVDSVGKYPVGALVVMVEIDSWVPTELAPFLSKGKEPKEYNGIKGERLRTVRLKKQLSQGLILPLSVLPVWYNGTDIGVWKEHDDATDILGIQKWEAPADYISADAKGNFPSFIPKTSQERIQNCYGSLTKEFQELTWEVTEKIHGCSFTAYFTKGDFGVCSRNLDLKDSDNNFWNTARKYDLQQKLSALGRNIAIQGEQYGVGINGNNYKLSGVELLVFNIYCIDSGTYLSTLQCRELSKELGLETVPVIWKDYSLAGYSLEYLLDQANGESVLAKTKREGFVFKSTTSDCSFKVVSNEWLLKNE
jgi:RNA ligase (TIGR02306 family)